MNEIQQLKILREEAHARLEAGHRALQESPDQKLVDALEEMIIELGGDPAAKDCRDLSLDELIAELEGTDEVEKPDESPPLNSAMSVEAYLEQMEVMSAN